MTSEERVKELMASAKFLLGFYNVEDIIQIPGTKWIVGGGITCYGPNFCDKVITTGYWHVFDAETETGFQIDSSTIEIAPEADRFPVTETPEWAAFGPHGFGFYGQDGDTIEVYAASHANVNGGREAIEVFRIDTSGDFPSFDDELRALAVGDERIEFPGGFERADLPRVLRGLHVSSSGSMDWMTLPACPPDSKYSESVCTSWYWKATTSLSRSVPIHWKNASFRKVVSGGVMLKKVRGGRLSFGCFWNSKQPVEPSAAPSRPSTSRPVEMRRCTDSPKPRRVLHLGAPRPPGL